MQYLFVYGTLLKGIDGPMARYLSSHASFIGEGFLHGRLYDMGSYPGLVYDADVDAHVYGHIFQLRDSREVLQTLDRYEGIDPDRPTECAYHRQACPVLSDNKTLHCETYLYQFSVSGLHQIRSGNYLQYLNSGDADHWGFIEEGKGV